MMKIDKLNVRYHGETVGTLSLAADDTRIHTATAGGLLCLSLANPVLDYSNLLALTINQI